MASLPALFVVIVFYSSSRNTRDFNHEIRAQDEIWLHREYNLAMKIQERLSVLELLHQKLLK